jgi:hypothetical protein
MAPPGLPFTDRQKRVHSNHEQSRALARLFYARQADLIKLKTLPGYHG